MQTRPRPAASSTDYFRCWPTCHQALRFCLKYNSLEIKKDTQVNLWMGIVEGEREVGR